MSYIGVSSLSMRLSGRYRVYFCDREASLWPLGYTLDYPFIRVESAHRGDILKNSLNEYYDMGRGIIGLGITPPLFRI